MKCYYHPAIDAVGSCISCGKAICQEDAVEVSGKIVCKECLATAPRTSIQTKPREPTNTLAITSLILAILGLPGCCCGGVFGGLLLGFPAAITGYIARKQIRNSSEPQQGEPFALVGMIIGGGLIVIALIFLVFFGSVTGLAFFTDLFDSLNY